MVKKRGQKIRAWVDPPPIIRAMPERKRFFSIDVFPYKSGCPVPNIQSILYDDKYHFQSCNVRPVYPRVLTETYTYLLTGAHPDNPFKYSNFQVTNYTILKVQFRGLRAAWIRPNMIRDVFQKNRKMWEFSQVTMFHTILEYWLTVKKWKINEIWISGHNASHMSITAIEKVFNKSKDALKVEYKHC